MINLDNKLLNNIESYCKLNDLDPSKFTNDLLKKALAIEMYGERPPIVSKTETVKEKAETIQEEPKTENVIKNETVSPQEPVEETIEQNIIEEVVKPTKKKRKLK